MSDHEFNVPVDDARGFTPGSVVEFPHLGRLFRVEARQGNILTLRELQGRERWWQRVRRLLNRLRPLS